MIECRLKGENYGDVTGRMPLTNPLSVLDPVFVALHFLFAFKERFAGGNTAFANLVSEFDVEQAIDGLDFVDTELAAAFVSLHEARGEVRLEARR